MKKRRLIISLFLLVALVSIGVGYAALTNNLLVNTDVSANINNGNLKVEFVDVVNTTESDPIVVSLRNANEVDITFNKTNSMNAKGDTQSVELKVRNNSVGAVADELDAVLSSFEVVSNTLTKDEQNSTDARVVYIGNYFTVVVEWLNASDLVLEAAREGVTAGENTLKITMTLNVTVTSEVSQRAFAIKFNAKTA